MTTNTFKYALLVPLLALLVPLFALLIAPSASAQVELDEQRIERIWRMQWRKYAKDYVSVLGEYKYKPDFDPRRYGNSLRLTPDKVTARLSRQKTVKQQRGKYTVDAVQVLKPPKEEVEYACNALWEYRVGEYGYIHSFVLERVLGDDDMVVRSVKLIDESELRDAENDMRRKMADVPNYSYSEQEEDLKWAFQVRNMAKDRNSSWDRGFRIRGISTKGLVTGQRYPRTPGLQVAIIGTSPGSIWSNDQQRRIHLIVPTSIFKPVRTEEEFLDLLKSRNLTKDQFIELVVAADDLSRVSDEVIAKLEEAQEKDEESSDTGMSELLN